MLRLKQKKEKSKVDLFNTAVEEEAMKMVLEALPSMAQCNGRNAYRQINTIKRALSAKISGLSSLAYTMNGLHDRINTG